MSKCTKATYLDLKSNMDRFIETEEFILLNKIFHLKSNMDRFIVSENR